MDRAINEFTTASNDDLHFWKNNVVDSKKVCQFVRLRIRDVAGMTGVPKTSVRTNGQTPDVVREHMEAIAITCNLVYEFFNDEVKTKLWLQTPNPMLGSSSPRDMIRMGRCKKLLAFVEDALENMRADGSAQKSSSDYGQRDPCSE